MRKATFFAVLLLVVSASCRPEAPSSFADRFIAAENRAWSAGDLQALEAIEDPNVIYHLPGGVDLKGWKAHEDFIVNGRKTASELRQQWKYLSGEGSHFVLSYTSSAVVSGNRVSNDYLFAFRTKDGRVVEVWANGSSSSNSAR